MKKVGNVRYYIGNTMPIGVIFIKTCTFFGHRDCPYDIKYTLLSQIEKLIVKHNVKTFYVGNKGSFDSLCRSCLKELQNVYTDLEYYVVLERIPTKEDWFDYTNTIVPENIENVMPKFAINYRNNWMISKSNYVIAYVNHSFGGAAKFLDIAKKKGKIIINIADS